MTATFHNALTYTRGNAHCEIVTPERFQPLYDFLEPQLLEAEEQNLFELFNLLLDFWCLYESLEEAEYDYEYGFYGDPIINPDGSVWVFDKMAPASMYRRN